MKEPTIIINGTTLTEAQALAVRAAVTGHDFDCGPGPGDIEMQRAYEASAAEVLKIMMLDNRK